MDAAPSSPAVATKLPLVVELDGALLRTNLLLESLVGTAVKGFRPFVGILAALVRGRGLETYVCDHCCLEYDLLPYDEAVLSVIRSAQRQGRPVYLATGGDVRHAVRIAAHLGLGGKGTEAETVLRLGAAATDRPLVDLFGASGFDYVGKAGGRAVARIGARKVYLVGAHSGPSGQVTDGGTPVEHLLRQGPSLRSWSKALRVHQYSKNVLVGVPALTAHVYALSLLSNALLAFVAFSLCASAAYILNDLVDLDADRRHPTKRHRPFCSGEIPIEQGLAAVPVLLGLAFGAASLVSIGLASVLAGYFALTLSYTFSLKRKLLVDVVVLATLYTLRVIGGAVALPVMPSEWLLAFSMFIFVCLALVKRYVELQRRIGDELPDPSNRNYRLADLPVVGALAAASGFNAVTIFALYISSPTVKDLYKRPELLWLICPILLYWIGRAVVLAHRRIIDDDPITFALNDRISYIAGILMFAIILAAT